MVNHGIPSKACNECRVRRTRCNKASPSCVQCVKRGRVCQYRDPLTVMFKSQNEQLHRPRIATTSKVWSKQPCKNNEIQMEPNQQPLERSLSVNVTGDDYAISHMFHNYVFKDIHISASRGFFDYLPDLIISSPSSRFPYLHEAIIALGLAGIAHQDTTGRTMRRARAKYNNAVSQISHLLSDVKEAKKNELLVAVTILGLFESCASSLPRSMASWMQHALGSYSILRLRGNEMLQTFIGRRLFLHVRTQFIRTCVQLRMALPPEIDEHFLLDMPGTSTSPGTRSTRSLFIGMRAFCALRASIKKGEELKDPHEIIASCRNIDALLREWEENTPPGYGYTVATVAAPCEDVYASQYYIYGDVFVAQLWNNCQRARCITHKTIIEQLNRLILLNPDEVEEYHTQIASSQAIIHRLGLDTCASVPFHFDFHLPVSERRPKAIGGNLLMWALYSVSLVAQTESRMLVWLVGRLRKIARELGVGHAAALAEICVRRSLLPWKEGIQGKGELQRVNRDGIDGSATKRVSKDEEDDRWEAYLAPMGNRI